MSALTIEHLCKHYPNYTLEDFQLHLEENRIMGLIGKNGAGKSTIIKSILHMVNPDQGTIEIYGKSFLQDEVWCKQQLGVVLGAVDYYEHKKLSTITAVTKRFYEQWDDPIYEHYMKMFELDPNKRIHQLSAGMKVKYAIALALSHHARLFIFDEPTSGLDPISRDEVLELFQALVKGGNRSILFSTHITSDLEKCADDITYLHDGKLLLSADKETFIQTFQTLKTSADISDLSLEEIMIRNERRFRHEAIII